MMLAKMFQGLQVKVLVSLAAVFLLVLGIIISLNMFGHKRDVSQQTTNAGLQLADAVYTSIVFPMSQGDSKTVKRQMGDFGKFLTDVEILIFGIDKKIVYASKEGKAGKDLAEEIREPSVKEAVEKSLAEGEVLKTSYEETLGGARYLSVVRPILNGKRCYHCHGSSHPVLGGLVVRQLNESAYVSMSSLRNRNLIIGLGGGFLTILLVSFLIARLVIRPVKEIRDQAEAMAKGDLTRELTWTSRDELGDLASSFGQMTEHLKRTLSMVEDSAIRLAEGASEQASAVEETSASIEQIASMMKQNTENSNEANKLMDNTKEMLAEANISMKELIRSLEETSAASDNIGKIVKTIQEIAFQTNLLALNAAVEAARAGETGAGFAVVAEEVRNLAMRSAESAQDTEQLVEGIVRKIKDGTELVQKTGEKYREVSASTDKAVNLISEITAAIREQSGGIEQVNKAIVEIDKVAQNVAAAAEKLSSSIAIFQTDKEKKEHTATVPLLRG